MNVRDLFFALLSFEIAGAAPADGIPASLSSETATALFALAERHSLLHLITDAIEKNGIAVEDGALREETKRKKQYQLAHFLQMEYCFEQLRAALDAAKIPYLPLKGAVLRRYYPEEWMRNSCDIDILVREEDRAAAEAAVEEIGFTDRRLGSHDVSFFLGQVHLELHYSLLEDDRANDARFLLARVWEYAQKKTDSFEYELSDEMFFFYHLVHMAKHIEIGGCGVRSFADLWILDHAVPFDREKREALLRQGDLLQFARKAEALSEIWFSGAEPTEDLCLFEEYILTGGTYGNIRNRVYVSGARTKNKLSYLRRIIFPSRETLSFRFPILKKFPFLLPFCWIARWFSALFRPSARKTLKTGVEMTGKNGKEELEKTKQLMRSLGLKSSGEN